MAPDLEVECLEIIGIEDGAEAQVDVHELDVGQQAVHLDAHDGGEDLVGL